MAGEIVRLRENDSAGNGSRKCRPPCKLRTVWCGKPKLWFKMPNFVNLLYAFE